jgi:HlyD family secretion protein
MPLDYGNITQTVSANGTLNPVTVVQVGSQVSGTVQKLFVDYNSHVHKGEALLQLDQTLFKAQVKPARRCFGTTAPISTTR